MKLSLHRCVVSSLFFLLLMTHLSQQSHDAGCAQRLSVSEDLYGNDGFHVMKLAVHNANCTCGCAGRYRHCRQHSGGGGSAASRGEA